MLDHIRQTLGFSDSAAGAVARAAFVREYPDFACHTTRIRATEEERFVVAVFYTSERPIMPSPYKLYTVARDLASAQELSYDPSSPYWIRGRK